MKPHPLARRYARALFELAHRADRGEEILQQFQAFDAILDQQTRIRAYLYSPQVDSRRKLQLLDELLSGKVDDLFYRFIVVVVQKRRQTLFHDMFEHYHLFYDQKIGRLRAQVLSAVAIDHTQVLAIQERLSRYLKATVVCDNEVDEDILGGLIVQVGGKVVDGSLRNQLQRLHRELMQAKCQTSL